MTVIIGLTIGNAPALLGDALVTSSSPSEARLTIPTLENANEYFGSTLYAHVPKLRQKVNILSDKVIVSWSGSYLHAHSLLREISEQLARGEDVECAANIIRAMPETEKTELSVIAFVRGPEKTTFIWNGATWHFDSTIFSKLVGAGSGAQDMASLIRRLERSLLRVNEDLPDVSKVAMYGMLLGSQAVGLEYLTKENLLMSWGGIVETAIFNGGVARKVGEILYAFWECHKQGNEAVLQLVPTFIKQEYQGDLLVTRTVSEKEAPRVVVIPPLLSKHKAGDRIGIRAPRLSYDWLCSCVVVHNEDRPIDVFAQVGRNLDTHPISFVESQSIFPYKYSLTSSVQRRYIEQMLVFVRDVLGPEAKLSFAGTSAW
jgi:hypothetical protein